MNGQYGKNICIYLSLDIYSYLNGPFFFPSLDTCTMFSQTDHSRANTLQCSVCPRGNNQYDIITILVIALSAAGCKLVRLLERVTRGPPNTQRVLNVAGLTIGRVSANLSAFINTNLNLHNLLKVTALFMGHIIHGRVVRVMVPNCRSVPMY